MEPKIKPLEVLVVDDEPHIRRLVSVNLQRSSHPALNRGYKSIETGDGQEALDYLKLAYSKGTMPDLVILDVMMPRIDGFGTLKEIRANYGNQLPVIMLTAKAQDEDIFRGWAGGCTAYLTKPFNPRELLLFVERSLTPTPPDQAGNVYEV